MAAPRTTGVAVESRADCVEVGTVENGEAGDVAHWEDNTGGVEMVPLAEEV